MFKGWIISHHLIQPPVVEPIPGETGNKKRLENAAKNNKQLFAGETCFHQWKKNIYINMYIYVINNNIYIYI